MVVIIIRGKIKAEKELLDIKKEVDSLKSEINQDFHLKQTKSEPLPQAIPLEAKKDVFEKSEEIDSQPDG